MGRIRTLLQNLGLLAGSTLVALLLCEIGLRLFAAAPDAPPISFHATEVPPGAGGRGDGSPSGQPDGSAIPSYVAEIPLAPGVERSWFLATPAPISRGSAQTEPDDVERMREYIRVGHYGAQAFYLWNENFLQARACDPSDKLFQDVPPVFRAFHSLDATGYPHFRFPPNRIIPTGLQTNRYGFRGPDFPPPRQPGVLRIAIVGSSGTIGDHHHPFAYPDFVGFWLEKWLRAHGSSDRVQILNAGREGIGTTDVRAVLEQEVLPLRPDIVVFYDGANQLSIARDLLKAARPIDRAAHQQGPAVRSIPVWLTAYSRLAALLEVYLARAKQQARAREPKPDYVLAFKPDFHEDHPDVTRSDLPLEMSTFLHDVSVMIDDTRAAGVPFVMATLPWLDGSEGTKPSDPRYMYILQQLDTTFWPLRSADLRRLIELQNRLLREFAAEKHVPLLDVAEHYPRNPDLFIDLYHHTFDGDRLLAWIMLQELIPTVRQTMQRLGPKIGEADGAVPHSADLSSFEVRPVCGPTHGMQRMARNVPLVGLIPAGAGASVTGRSRGRTVHTAAQTWAYAARLELNANCLDGDGWVVADVRVLRGSAGVGVLNTKETEFAARQILTSVGGTRTVALHFPSFRDVGALMIQNADDPTASEIRLRSVRIVTAAGTPIAACPIVGRLADQPAGSAAPAVPGGATLATTPVDLSRFVKGSADAIFGAGRTGVDVLLPHRQWSFGAALALDLPDTAGPVWVRVEAVVGRGVIGVDLWDRVSNAFVSRAFSAATPETTVFMLPLPKSGPISLVVENAAPTPTPSAVRILKVEVLHTAAPGG